jgi:hypothetical protein
VLCRDTGGVRSGERGTVVGFYATDGEVEYAVSFAAVDALLRLPFDALGALDED